MFVADPTTKIPSVVCGVPEEARNLIWQTFFVDANRGVNFAAHLPWEADPGVRTVMLAGDCIQAVAAAVMRPAHQTGVVMLGYVCVDPAVRGQGYGKALIAAVNTAIDDLDYRASLLWTSKPEVYAGQGYSVVGQDNFVRVTCLTAGFGASVRFAATAWPSAGDHAGLPTFATFGRRLRSDCAEAIVVEGPRGATLIGWKGDATDIAALVGAGGYGVWSLNLSAKDDFAKTLPTNHYSVESWPGATAMVRRADPSFVIDPIPVADRI
ncbi:GNAT family N-acetyltransferase (plasmid) [Sphingomonadaceae bacterium OTU29MARTA1]|nr:GNAT family N-acetyltransferase [Sphingomonadaceae bacterium OTU29MARTA1]